MYDVAAEGSVPVPRVLWFEQGPEVLGSRFVCMARIEGEVEYVLYATATDELDWIGSRDAWLDLEGGAISNYGNEFTD